MLSSLEAVNIFRLHGKRDFIDVMKITDFMMGKLFWINQTGVNLITWTNKGGKRFS